MVENQIYRVYSDYLKEIYGEKVYRIPVNLPVSCPNRDPETGRGGCSFCGEVAAGFESLSNSIPVKEQIQKNIDYIGKKYKAKKFIVYFQNFTNTYLPLESFKQYLNEAVRSDVVEISISTRPDSINEKYLDLLKEIADNTGIAISIELGLQSINHRTLKAINRGHSLAEFIDGVLLIKKYGFFVTAHMILNLPYDDDEDVIEGAKILSSLGVNGVKLHSLYILKDTPLATEYKEERIHMGTVDRYVNHTISFLEYLSPTIIIQRLVGRAPEEETIFCNYGISWWKIKDKIIERMMEKGSVQGIYCNYLGGKAVREFSN